MACEKEAGSAPTGPQLKYSSSYSTLSPDVVEQSRSTYTSQPPPSMAHGLKEKPKENHGSLTSGKLCELVCDNFGCTIDKYTPIACHDFQRWDMLPRVLIEAPVTCTT
jgi:hypothetical protein